MASSNVGGIAAMLLACALFVIGDSIFKLLGRTLPLGEMLFVRGLMSLPVIFLMAAYAGALAGLGAAVREPRVLIRALLEIPSTALFFAALIQMRYSDAVAIHQVAPLTVTAGAALFLGQPVGWRRWLAALAGFVGVLVVIRPGAGAFNWPALVMLGAVGAITAREMVARGIGPQIPTVLVALVSIAAVGVAGLLFWPFEHWVPLGIGGSLLIAVAAASSTGGYYWSVEALRRGEVAAVMPFRYSLIPYGVISGIVVFGEWPDLTTLTGIAIVLGAGLYTLHRERVRALLAGRR